MKSCIRPTLLVLTLLVLTSLVHAQVTITQFITTVQNQGCYIPIVASFGIQGYIDNYAMNDSVTVYIDFGDSNDTTFRASTQQSFQYGYFYTYANHTYTTVNIFPVVAIVTGPNNFVDTATSAFMTTTTCNNVTGKLFLDLDGSCAFSSSDSVLANIPIYLKNNGHVVAQGGTNALGNYLIDAAPGFTYQLFAGDPSSHANIPLTCSSSQGMSITPSPSINQDLIVLDTSTVTISLAMDSTYQALNNCAPYSTNFSIFGRVFNPLPQDSIELYFNFGDGGDTTFWVDVWPTGPYEAQFSGAVPHTFTAGGVYNALYTATRIDGTADTLVHYAEVVIPDSCGSLQGYAYNDLNGNCIYDGGDLPLRNELITLTLNNTSVANTLTDWSGHYSIDIASGNYTLAIHANGLSAAGYAPSCPSSASASVAVLPNTTTFTDFGVVCLPGFNLVASTINFWGMITPTTPTGITPQISNQSCNAITGMIHLILDTNVTFVSNSNTSNTYTFSGDTISWPFSGITNTTPYVLSPWYNVVTVQGVSSLLPTDVLCFQLLVTPLSGDINLSDNVYTHCELAYTPHDPNAKYVSPEGIGATGIIPAGGPLTYTVEFQNTGTFAARDIFVLDTLDSDLDISTLVILGSSHNMSTQILPGNILRFNFPLIWLPDSASNEPASHGWLQFSIDQKQNLAPGTVFENTAAIYFDFNAPIFTNTTINTIENPLGVASAESTSEIRVFPNPTDDVLQVVFAQTTTGTLQLTDALGRVVMTKNLVGEKTVQLNTDALPAGVYLLHVQTSAGVRTERVLIAR